METPFAPELQQSWRLVELRMVPDSQIVITVEAAESIEPPAPLGRHVSDVMSWPEVFRVSSRAEFRFSDVVYVGVTDEAIDAIAPVHRSDHGAPEGTFRRISASTLLDNATASQPGRGEPFRHYRLMFLDEVLDVVCGTPPTVVLKK